MPELQLRQFFDQQSCTYSYFLIDPASGELAIIDPVHQQLERDRQSLQELGVELKYIFETHVHADHVTSAGLLRETWGGQIVVSANSGHQGADCGAQNGDSFKLGTHSIECLETPGHTNACLSYRIGECVFTGDALLIRACGRTDFQSGDNGKLFHSVREILFALPETCRVYPGHDYQGRPYSTIAQEQRYNPRLGLDKSFEDFCYIMDGLNLSCPDNLQEVLARNLRLGLSI